MYGPASGTRSVRFVLAGDQGFLLPDTMQLKCIAKAANGANVASDIGLAACFTPFCCYVGGSPLEGISSYSRCVAMPNMRGPKEAAADFSIMAGDSKTDFPASGELVPSMPVISGLRFAQKALPLKPMGSLVLDWEITPVSADFADAAWTLENPVLMCDLLGTPEAQSAIEKRILSAPSVPITLSTFFSTTPSVTSDATVNISRGVSKLTRVFVSYTAAAGDSSVNVFRHPTGDFIFQMRISSKMIPANAIEDGTTVFHQLHKALGSHKGAARSINIDKAGYAGTEHLLWLSTEKLEGAPWSGISPANGDLVSLQIKNAGGVGFQYAVFGHEIV